MNRREAFKALVGLPMLSSLSIARLEPTDVIVAECDGLLSSQGLENIRAVLRDVWPNHRIVVCDRGMRLKVMRQGESMK